MKSLFLHANYIEGKNMAEILKFIYVMIIFLFMCIIVTNGNYLCDEDKDCPKNICLYNEYPRCMKGICRCVKL
ncbi:unnamed protein product [Trifolium pratense]|uniref:Uncharacterized protein n=1 Tax=Trifolium pratense TaxID=57577 RepID=A0ACB0KS17_TRIPR|nr:unnamed protein product [Trifolium pratense]